MKIPLFPRFSFFVLIAFLSVGAIAKKQDPILKTQTDPVDYREKQKEEREGKKGPPVPTIELFPRQRFLVEGPVDKTKRPPVSQRKAETELWLEEEEGEEGDEFEDEFKLELETDDMWEAPEGHEEGVS